MWPKLVDITKNWSMWAKVYISKIGWFEQNWLICDKPLLSRESPNLFQSTPHLTRPPSFNKLIFKVFPHLHHLLITLVCMLRQYESVVASELSYTWASSRCLPWSYTTIMIVIIIHLNPSSSLVMGIIVTGIICFPLKLSRWIARTTAALELNLVILVNTLMIILVIVMVNTWWSWWSWWLTLRWWSSLLILENFWQMRPEYSPMFLVDCSRAHSGQLAQVHLSKNILTPWSYARNRLIYLNHISLL